MYNNSELITLSSNIDAVRGKRALYFMTSVHGKTEKHLIPQRTSQTLTASSVWVLAKTTWFDPPNMPLQLIYASSAGDATYPFYDKYRTFAKKMFEGGPQILCL